MRRRRVLALAVVLVTGVGAGWFVVAGPPGGPGQATPRRRHGPTVPGWSLIATIHTPTPGYAVPGAATPQVSVPVAWMKASSGRPVIASEHGWVEVRVVSGPPAPSSAWVRRSAVALSRTPYYVVVDLRHARVLLFRRGALVTCAPAAVGSPAHPTPVGHFFVALLARASSPFSGPFVLVTSAVANTVTDWQQAGRPMITVEGSLGGTSSLSSTSPETTTGSVRLSVRDLRRLRVLPVGTPLDVVPSFPSPRKGGRRCAAALRSNGDRSGPRR